MILRCVMTQVAAWVLATAAFSVGTVHAEKPDWAGGGKASDNHEKKHEKKYDKQHESSDERRSDDSRASLSIGAGGVAIYFGDRERQVARDYYQAQARAGKCPPGLAKKNNDCLPPGQAKKWARGKPIGELQVHDLPYDLRMRLPVPPAGHRYVQVAADVLMIAVGTGIVVDAIEDLIR